MLPLNNHLQIDCQQQIVLATPLNLTPKRNDCCQQIVLKEPLTLQLKSTQKHPFSLSSVEILRRSDLVIPKKIDAMEVFGIEELRRLILSSAHFSNQERAAIAQVNSSCGPFIIEITREQECNLIMALIQKLIDELPHFPNRETVLKELAGFREGVSSLLSCQSLQEIRSLSQDLYGKIVQICEPAKGNILVFNFLETISVSVCPTYFPRHISHSFQYRKGSKLLDYLLQQHKLTIEEFAKKSGIQVWKLENFMQGKKGNAVEYRDLIARLGQYFDYEPEYFFEPSNERLQIPRSYIMGARP